MISSSMIYLEPKHDGKNAATGTRQR